MNERDVDVLKSILKYCEQIDDANRQFNFDKEDFEKIRFIETLLQCVLCRSANWLNACQKDINNTQLRKSHGVRYKDFAMS